jgi:hypothetical protein
MSTNPIAVLRQDTLLVTAAAGGDQGAWDALVGRYAQLVWDVARSCRLDRAAAAEVCSITWLRCADHLHELVGEGTFSEWLTAAAMAEAGRAAVAHQPTAGAPVPVDAIGGGAISVLELPPTPVSGTTAPS